MGQMLWFLRINALVCKSLIDFNEAFIPYNEPDLRMTQHCCALTHRTDLYCAWISDTGS